MSRRSVEIGESKAHNDIGQPYAQPAIKDLMPHFAALRFLLKRGADVCSSGGMTTTRETVHGLLRLEDDELTIQWRVVRKTEHIGAEIRTDQEVEPVRKIVVPLRGVAGVVVRRRWWDWLFGPRLVLPAADVSALEGLVGRGGLSLDHPGAAWG